MLKGDWKMSITTAKDTELADKLCNQIAEDGYRMRVYVPFGEQWYPYSIRRLKENPQMAGYIIKNLLFRN